MVMLMMTMLCTGDNGDVGDDDGDDVGDDDDCSTLSFRSIPQYLRRFRFHPLGLVGGSL